MIKGNKITSTLLLANICPCIYVKQEHVKGYADR